MQVRITVFANTDTAAQGNAAAEAALSAVRNSESVYDARGKVETQEFIVTPIELEEVAPNYFGL